MPLLLFAGKAAGPFRRGASRRVRVGLRAAIRGPLMGSRPARIAVLHGPLRRRHRSGHTLQRVWCAHPAIGPWIALSLPSLAGPALRGRVRSGVGCALRCGVSPWVAARLLMPTWLPTLATSSRRLWHRPRHRPLHGARHARQAHAQVLLQPRSGLAIHARARLRLRTPTI